MQELLASSSRHPKRLLILAALSSLGVLYHQRQNNGRPTENRSKSFSTVPSSSSLESSDPLTPIRGSTDNFLMPPATPKGSTDNFLVPPSTPKGQGTRDPSGSRNLRIRLDKQFFRRLYTILKIVFPKWTCKETLYLVALSILLMLRTYMSVIIARIAGRNGQNLVARRMQPFFEGVFLFLLVTLPAAFVNSSLKFLTSVLALRVRVRLSNHVHDEYLRGVNFYKANNLGDIHLDNPDQRVTSDIANFSESSVHLFTESFKPLLDVVLFTKQLIENLGWQGPACMYAYFAISALVKKKIMPSFGKMVAKESALEGKYRSAHTRLITNSEEVAFYKGGKKERQLIEQALQNIFDHIKSWKKKQVIVGVFDGLLVKYWASIAGYCVVLIPFLMDLPHVRNKASEEITRDYILNTQYLMALSQAVGQLVLLGNKLNTIAGYTHRVSELLEMSRQLNGQGSRAFTVVASEKEEFQPVCGLEQWLVEWKDRCKAARQHRLQQHDNDAVPFQGGGTIVESEDYIRFEDCDLVAPDGQLLARKLNFQVQPGKNVMITGPNGCGKSSMFRVIGELWPLQNGTLHRPRGGDIVFVPQKPYLVQGTLRDQVIYPHSEEEMAARGVSDTDLERLLAAVDPRLTMLNTWKWDDRRNWASSFSGGQKQRIAMARLFYHCPAFAILDECTSSVSDEVEDAIYETCKILGITIFTVSHRPSLRRHHESILEFDGRGAWDMYPVVN